MKKIIISFLFILNFSAVSAQHDHDFLNDPMSKKSDVQYTIRASVDAEYGVVKGTLELEFTNNTDDIIEDLSFSVLLNEFREGTKLANRYFLVDYDTLFTSDTSSGYIKIDSINYLGVTLGSETYSIKNGLLRVKLPSPVNQGDTRYLFMSFESKIPVVIEERRFVRLFKDFYPKLLLEPNDRYDFGWYEHRSPYADYNLELTVDSGYRVSHPGKLINESSIYSSVIRGSITFNILEHIASEKQVTYFISQKSSRDFQFSIGRNVNRNILIGNQYTIYSQFNSDKCKYEWEGRTVQVADSLIKQLEKSFIPFPYKKLELCAIDSTFLQFGSCPIIFIPSDVKKEYDMALYILSELTKLYVPQIHSDKVESGYFSDGFATYLTMKTAFDFYGNDGYSDLKRYEKRLRKKTKAYKLLEKDKKALDPLGYPITVTDNDIAADIENLPVYFHNRFRRIPAWFETVRYIVGDSVFQDALIGSLNGFRFKSLTVDEFIPEFAKSLNNQSVDTEYLYDLLIDIDSIDFDLQNPKIENKNDSSYITGQIVSNTKTVIPIDIAFVDIRNDTLYKRILPTEFESNTYSLSEKIDNQIKLIILNPHYAHGELTRSNNYYSLTPQKFNMQEPGWFFPGFQPF